MNGQTLVKALIPLPVGATAVYTSSGLTYYRHRDHLGSSRLATTPGRTLYSSTAYAPYGEPYAQAGTTDLSFTGIETDTTPVTTNGTTPAMYDSLMRKQSPVQGRWLSPDPAGLAAVDASTPQTWNRYAYVTNNPMALVDPLGLCVLGGALPCISGGHGSPHPNSPNSSGDSGGGGGLTCIMDGVETDCGMVESALDNGNASICPPGGVMCANGRNGGLYQLQDTGDDGLAWVRVDAIDVINTGVPTSTATSSKNCSFNIALGNTNLLTHQELTDAEAEINRILGIAGLGANFTSDNADFTIDLKNNPTGLVGSLLWGEDWDTLGKNTGWFGPTNSADVWVNNVEMAAAGMNLGTALGRTMTHEVGHWALNMVHSYPVPGPLETNIMSQGLGPILMNGMANLSPAQISKLRSKCQGLHP